MLKKPKILVAPLDWGLGHTTRCIPIIEYLQELGAEVLFAGNASQIGYISREIQGIQCIELDGYNVRYGKNKWQTILKLASSIPRLFVKVYRENLWLQKIVRDYELDAVISDNRYGLYHHRIPSVCITHQLNIQSPKGKKLINFLCHIYLRKFDKVWVPDESDHRYAGILSENTRGLDITYLGILSRMKQIQENNPTQDCLLIMSGVSPAKEIFRDEVIASCKKANKQLTIVGNDRVYQEQGLQSLPYQNTAQLQKLIADHHLVISRIGYTTIMDLSIMGKNALLIPTPGQGEQEYLAHFYKDKHFIIQDHVDIESAWANKDNKIPQASERYHNILQEWFAHLNV